MARFKEQQIIFHPASSDEFLPSLRDSDHCGSMDNLENASEYIIHFFLSFSQTN